MASHSCTAYLYLNITLTTGSKITAYQAIKLYRKLKADNIFTGKEIFSGDHVLITEASGKIIEIIDTRDAGENIEYNKGLICPGFINCHCHIELSYLKDVIQPLSGLVTFVQAVMANRNFPLDQRLTAMQNAADELYETGIVAVGDICNNGDSVLLKKNSPLYWNNFIEVSGFVNASAEKRFVAAESVARSFSTLSFPYSIVPHAPYSVSKKLFELINEKSSGQLITIHNQEEKSENDLYKNKTGEFLKLYESLGIEISCFSPTQNTSFQSWLPYFTNGQRIISVHNIFISQEDINLAKNIFFCVCINANLYIEESLPPLDLLIKNNCTIVLGTDSYASNRQLNMIEEMKTIQKNFPSVKTETILKWATINGAEALGITETFGSFFKGKTPGIVLIENIDEGIFSPATKAKRLL